jgi:hypothetical protein
MGILFLILKIIGIVLLIPIVLILIFAICPISYGFDGRFEEKKPDLRAKARWAVLAFRFKIRDGSDPEAEVKLFGIPLYRIGSDQWYLLRPNKKKPAVKKSKKKRRPSKPAKSRKKKQEETVRVNPEPEFQKKEDITDVFELPWEEDMKISDQGDAENNKTKKSLWKTIVDFFKKCYNKCRTFAAKLKDLMKKGISVKEMLQDEMLQKAFCRCAGYGKELFVLLIPQKIYGHLIYGMSDPAQTGEILGVLAALLPVYGRHLDVTPDFSKEVLEGELYIRGKIRRYKILGLLWKVYKDKDLMKQKDRAAEMIGGLS